MTRSAIADIDRQTVDCIKTLTKQKGWAPTLQEIATCLQLSSKSGAWRRVQRLIEAGLVETIPGAPRAVRIK